MCINQSPPRPSRRRPAQAAGPRKSKFLQNIHLTPQRGFFEIRILSAHAGGRVGHASIAVRVLRAAMFRTRSGKRL